MPKERDLRWTGSARRASLRRLPDAQGLIRDQISVVLPLSAIGKSHLGKSRMGYRVPTRRV
jgi:hypothetical protein